MKKSIFMSLLAGITAISIVSAVLLSNKQQTNFLVGASTVSHQIVFSKTDSVALTEPVNEKGVEITKVNATRSGHSFIMKVYCYGNGGYYSYNNPEASCLLYCETKGILSEDPDSYVRVEFDLTNVASFTSVILHGTFYKNREKSLCEDSMTVPATYDKVNNKVTGRIEPFKAFVTSIELNYTCAA